MRMKLFVLSVSIIMISCASVCYARDLCYGYIEMKKYDDAILECTRQINGELIVADVAVSYTNRGLAYAGKKEYSRAIGDYDKAIELNSRYEKAFFNRGNAYYAKGQYSQAIDDYTEAIRLNPTNFYTYYNMACLHSVRNDPEEACKWLRKSVGNGFNDWYRIKRDKDLDKMRDSSCYKEIMSGK